MSESMADRPDAAEDEARPAAADNGGKDNPGHGSLSVALALVGAGLTLFMQAVPVVSEFCTRPLRSAATALGLLDVAAAAAFVVLRQRGSGAARPVLFLALAVSGTTLALAAGAAIDHSLDRGPATASPWTATQAGGSAPTTAAPQVPASATPPTPAFTGAVFDEVVTSNSGALVTDDIDTGHEVGRLQVNSDIDVSCFYQDTNPTGAAVDGYWYLIAAGQQYQGDWTPSNSYWDGGKDSEVDSKVPACPPRLLPSQPA